MYRNSNGNFQAAPPAFVTFDGYRRRFADLSREERDAVGWNEARPVKRESFTVYETRWVKGEDLIYREEVVSATVNEPARQAHASRTVRTERNRRLRESDWTQLADSVFDAEAMVLWQSYRQALRDVPQQAGFPDGVDWPLPPETE